MKKTSIFLLFILPFAIFAQKADQCLCTDEDFYDDNFLDLTTTSSKDKPIAVPQAQSVAYIEVNAFSYQQLAADVSFTPEAEEPSVQENIEEELIEEIVTDVEDETTDEMAQEIVVQKENSNIVTQKKMVKKRKKLMRTRIKSRKKVRKYRGKCPAF